MNPKLTIITPSFNSARFIEETIRSVKAQTYSPIEHLVMDGGSTDRTLDILRRYEDSYDLRWRSEPDRGQSHAFNKGIEAATGEWLYFLNSDDYLLDSDSISRVMDFIQGHPGYFIYMGKIWGVDAQGRTLTENTKPFGHAVYTQQILLNKDAMVVHQGTFYHRGVFETVGKYSEWCHYHMDYEFHLRVSKYFDILSMPLSMAALRTHPAAKTKQADSRRALEMFWARFKNGGRFFHKQNLCFFKSFLTDNVWSKPFYYALRNISLLDKLAKKVGWKDLKL